MRILVLLFALLVSPVAAQEAYTGTGIVCDTKEEVQRFVELFTNDVATATKKVNEEMGENACGTLTIIYLQGASYGRLRHNGKFAEIIKILVTGIYDGGWKQVTPVEQYTLIPVEGEDI